MEVVFIRHGHAIHNEGFEAEGESAYYSQKYTYSTLTQKGHTQTLGIDRIHVDCVFVSPLVRCIQTARNIFGSSRILYLHDGLIETQGHTPNQRETRDALGKYQNVSLKYVKTSFPDRTESETELRNRAIQTIRHILLESNGFKRIAIIGHHDWFKALLKKSFDNAEVFTITQSELERTIQ